MPNLLFHCVIASSVTRMIFFFILCAISPLLQELKYCLIHHCKIVCFTCYFSVSSSTGWRKGMPPNFKPCMVRLLLNIGGTPSDTFINMKVNGCYSRLMHHSVNSHLFSSTHSVIKHMDFVMTVMTGNIWTLTFFHCNCILHRVPFSRIRVHIH